MNKVLLATAICLILFTAPADAQVRVNLNVNVGQQPAWGPRGYDHVDYYYLPDIGAYYHVPQRQFVYPDRGRWVMARNLPPMYRSYDLYRGHKVVINEPRPWLRNDYYRSRYNNYRNDRVVVHNVRYDDRDNRGRNRNRGRGHAHGHYR